MLHYKARAKINLFLHVIGKLENGYHSLESLVGFSNIGDNLSFNFSAQNEISASGEFVDFLPNSRDNLIIKVIEFFQEEYCLTKNIKVTLEKNLPIGGGIGGGSSNCAISILAMNELFQLNLEHPKLEEIGLKFGADVPVCLKQKYAFFSGVGDKVDDCNFSGDKFKKIPMVLVNPKIPLLTKNVFSAFKQNYSKSINKDIFFGLSYGEFIYFLNMQRNDLERAACFLNPNISSILMEMRMTNSSMLRMSGSGSTCFALYDSMEDAEAACDTLRSKFPNYWVVSSFLEM